MELLLIVAFTLTLMLVAAAVVWAPYALAQRCCDRVDARSTAWDRQARREAAEQLTCELFDC